MKLARNVLVGVLSILLVLPYGVRAQQGPVADQAAIDRAVADHAGRIERDRRDIRRVLERKEVRQVAATAGVDVARAEAAVGTLDGAELREIARQARTVDEALAGGSSVTLSTTTIIIALLVLILIIVAVD